MVEKCCCNCKYWTWNRESEEWQCWRDDSLNSGIEMEDFETCKAIIQNGMVFEPVQN